ncbi:hypothetical protein Ancab_000866 [Ancistrocladus abbreviatus]
MEPSSKQLSDSIISKLSNLRPLSSHCCIYRVPEDLCSINREAYRPVVVSIGPFHYKDERLCAMEEYKLTYLKSFLTRAKSHNLEDYVSVVKGREKLVRECYVEEFTLSSGGFVEMVLVDAAFIIEVFLRCWDPGLREENDRIFARPWMITRVGCDIRLEENQLPFFIIQELYDFAFEPYGLNYPYFLDITGKFFRVAPRELRSEPKHFVDFLHACYLPSSPPPEPVIPSKPPFCFSVSYLHKAGVKIVPAKESSLLDITFHEGVLRIPKIDLQDSTESLWRNLVVFEQCHYIENSYITNYLVLLDCLIDDPKDVQILIENGILTNRLGNNENASNLFTNLVKQINIFEPNFYYRDVCQQLNDYCSSTWHKNKAMLRQKYFNHPWAVLSVISTIVLLLLTVIQAITGVISIIHM